MSILDRILRRTKTTPEARSWSVFRDAHLQGASTVTGETVNEDSALSVAAIYGCVRVLGEAVASLPLNLYRRLPDGAGRERVHDHPIVRLLEVAPNPDMTAFELRELRMTHLCLRGNAYHRIQRQGGRPVALWPLHPDAIEIRRDQRSGMIAYHYNPPTGRSLIIPAIDMLHFKGFGPNGLKGWSPLSVARETFGHYLAAQKFGGKFFNNNAWVSGIIKHPGKLDTETADRMAKGWARAHGGDNTGGIAVMEEGSEFQQLSLSPDDAQFIDTVKLKRSDVCAIFRVPPHMIADLERATFSNIESQDLFFAKHTIVPHCERQEQVLNMRLLTEAEQGTLYVEHNLAGLMRGDLASRVASYTAMWDRGILNADQILEMENKNPQPDGLGQKFYVPSNFIEAGVPRPTFTPFPPAADDEPNADDDDRAACDCGTEHRTVEYRSLPSRMTIQRSFVGVFDDAMTRVVRRDVQQIRAALKRTLRSQDSFTEWLTEYYDDTEYAQRQMRSAIAALAEALGPELAAETETEWAFNDALRAWVDAYVVTFAAYHARGAHDDIAGLVATADDNVADLIDARLEVWEQGDANGSHPRAAQVAGREATRFSGAFAKTVFAGAGVITLVWQTSGESCPWCDSLEGRVVGIEESFVAKGTVLNGIGGDTMNIGHNVMHPPLHDGCDCIITRG